MKLRKSFYLYLALLCLFFFTNSLLAQERLGCNTPDAFQRQLKELKESGDRLGLWIDEGYGSSCAHGCNNTHIPSNCNGSATYKVPVKFWLFADDNNTNQLVTPAIAAQHLAYVNNYYACQGIPIAFYQVADSPGSILSTDYNSFDTAAGDGDDSAVRNNTAYYKNNVINIYVPKELGNAGCNGYAYLPTSSTEVKYSAVMMDGVCFQNVVNVCTDPAWAVVLIHEMGHSFGLYHTHNPYEVGASPVMPTNECPDGTNACTAGDFIADTNADPNYSDACITKSGCDITGISCISPCGTPYSTTANTENNIMSYNNNIGCRLNYSTCQKTKMVDCLFQTANGGRSYLCDTDISRHFGSTTINAANSPYQEICVGGTIPTFTTLNANCYDWFSAATGGAAFLTNAGSFTPSAAQVPVNTPGTYRFYAQEINAYNTACRIEVYVKVNPKPGTGTPASSSLTGSSTLNLNTSSAGLASSGELVGWWIKAAPVTAGDFANQAALNTAVSAATIGGTIAGAAPNNLFASTVGSPKTGVPLSINCSGLTIGQTYYATPFVSKGGTTTPSCTVPMAIGSGTSGSNAAKFVSISSVSCRTGTPATSPTFSISITVSGYTGAANNLSIFYRAGGCFGGSFTGGNNGFAGNGTYTYSQANFPAGTDPGSGGLCLMMFENGGQGVLNATVSGSITVNYTYNLAFPDATLTPCAFGTPAAFVCAAALPIQLLDFQGKQVKNKVQLDWSTASESNNQSFTVSRSPDGLNFEFLKNINGAGNSTERKDYTMDDNRPFLGNNYYRLEQTDHDGRKLLVGTVVVNIEEQTALSIVPNPVTQKEFELKFYANAAQDFEYVIYNNLGQIIQQQSVSAYQGNNQTTIAVENLQTGMYHLLLKGQNMEHQFVNFVVR